METDTTFVVGDEVTVTELLAANGYPRLYWELRDVTGTVQEITETGYRVTFEGSEFAPKNGYEMNSLEIQRVYTGPTFLQLYRETMDEIRDGRNDQAALVDALYRFTTHPKYTHNGFGLVVSRLIKAHYERLESGE